MPRASGPPAEMAVDLLEVPRDIGQGRRQRIEDFRRIEILVLVHQPVPQSGSACDVARKGDVEQEEESQRGP